jgi:hypothetical protein
MTTSRPWRIAAVVAAAAFALGACGGDDDTASDGGGNATNDTAFCTSVADANRAAGSLQSGNGSPEEAEARLDALASEAPDDVSSDVDTYIAETKQLFAQAASGEEGGPPPIPSEELYDAGAAIGGWMEEHCDFPVLDVTAGEYTFEGIGETVPSGTTLVKFSNEGGEWHEAAIAKIADGEERSVEDLLQLPEEEAMSVTQMVGFTLAPPGVTSYTTVDFAGGRHVALCFVPVGTTPEAFEAEGPPEDAPPHFAHGMVAEFTVEA